MIKSFSVMFLKFSAVCVLGFVLVLTSSHAFRTAKEAVQDDRPIQYAKVDGNVQRPGYYRVDNLTTNYDVLAQAGMNQNSNVQEIDLHRAAQPGKVLEVGASSQNVAPKDNVHFEKPQCLHLLGSVMVNKAGQELEPKANQFFEEGYIVKSAAGGKAKLRFSNQADFNIGENTQMMIRRINVEKSPSSTEILVNEGSIWIKVPRKTPGASLTIFTPTLIIDFQGNAGECLVLAKPYATTIHMAKGKAMVILPGAGREVLLEGDQSISVRAGDDLLSPTAKKFARNLFTAAFGDLEQSYVLEQKSLEEVSMLIAGGGGYSMLLTLLPEKHKVVIMDLPPNTYVGDYIDGVFRLDQALMYIGPEQTRELVQRIIARPVKYVMKMDLREAMRFAYSVDELRLQVDPGAAFALGLSTGEQILRRENILRFLNPDLPGGHTAAVGRQKKVLFAFLRYLKKNRQYQHLLVNILSSMPTNLPAKDASDIFRIYLNEPNWSFSNITMPSSTYQVGPVVLLKPRYDLIMQSF